MIKWLSGSRLKTVTENESPSPLTNDPLAAITGIGTPDGKCHIYAVSRVNPLFKEEKEPKKEETETSINGTLDRNADQRLSPRKSISSGYESRCNSSSDSSSCTECEDKPFKKSLNGVKREKRLTKQSKKRLEYEKWDEEENEKLKIKIEGSFPSPTNIKRKVRKYKNGSPPGSSNLSPIPEGKVDCSIPPPIWPRFEENCTENIERNLDTQVPGRIFHNGSTNPLNFVFKYNEKHPRCCNGSSKAYWNQINENEQLGDLSVKTEYEHNWVECCRSQREARSYLDNRETDRKSKEDSGKGFAPEGTLERLPLNQNEVTEEVLKDLANLLAYAMSKKNSIPLDNILKNLADSIQKCLEVIAQTETDESLRILCENLNRNKYLNKMWTVLLNRDKDRRAPSLITGDESKNGVSTTELALKLQKLSLQNRENSKIGEDLNPYRINNFKDEIYSSGSEGKNSSSSSSGCKDLYISSNSSSAGKDNIFSASSFEFVHDGEKAYDKRGAYNSIRDSKKSSDEANTNKSDKHPVENVLSLIHHQRDLSSSSAESAFCFSDSSPTPSDSSSAKGVLNPVFLHENIYSVPKSVRNAIICESFNRTKDADCGLVTNCGSSAFEKLISAKRKTSDGSRTEELGALAYENDGKTRFPAVVSSAKMDNTVLKKIEHPYYIAMGRPDFTLDLPQAEKLMKKIASSKRRRCWCRLMTSILGLVFFLLSVMMVSLVVTKGRRMFGAL